MLQKNTRKKHVYFALLKLLTTRVIVLQRLLFTDFASLFLWSTSAIVFVVPPQYSFLSLNVTTLFNNATKGNPLLS